METEFIVHNENKYLEVITSGIADNTSSLEMAKLIGPKMREFKLTKALIDHTKISQVVGSIGDIYNRPSLFKIIGVLLGIKIAEVVRPEHEEHFKFLELVCLNRGYTFSVFFKKEEAINWLLD